MDNNYLPDLQNMFNPGAVNTPTIPMAPAVNTGVAPVVPSPVVPATQTAPMDLKSMMLANGIDPLKIQTKAFEDMEKAYKQMAGAAGAGVAASEKAIKPLLLDEQELAQKKQQIAQQEKRQTEMQKRTDAAAAHYQNMIEEYGNLGVNSNRLWGSMDTGSKITAALGVFLGALGGGANNSALKIVDNAIDRDIQAQKINIEKAGNALGAQRGLLGMLMEQTGDARAAENLYRGIIANNVEQQLKVAALKSHSGEVAAQANLGIAQLHQNMGTFYQNYAQRMQLENSINSLNSPTTSDNGEKENMALRALAASGPEGEKIAGRYINTMGVKGIINASEGKVEEIKDLGGRTKSITNTIDKLIGMKKDSMTVSWSKERGKAEALNTELQLALPYILSEIKRINGIEVEKVEGITELPTNFFAWTDKNVEALETLKDSLIRNFQNKGEAYHLSVNRNLGKKNPVVTGAIK